MVGERGLETRFEKQTRQMEPPWCVCRFREERWP